MLSLLKKAKLWVVGAKLVLISTQTISNLKAEPVEKGRKLKQTDRSIYFWLLYPPVSVSNVRRGRPHYW